MGWERGVCAIQEPGKRRATENMRINVQGCLGECLASCIAIAQHPRLPPQKGPNIRWPGRRALHFPSEHPAGCQLFSTNQPTDCPFAQMLDEAGTPASSCTRSFDQLPRSLTCHRVGTTVGRPRQAPLLRGPFGVREPLERPRQPAWQPVSDTSASPAPASASPQRRKGR